MGSLDLLLVYFCKMWESVISMIVHPSEDFYFATPHSKLEYLENDTIDRKWFDLGSNLLIQKRAKNVDFILQ